MDSFILRQISNTDFSSSNHMLGNDYSVIRRHNTTENKEEYSKWEHAAEVTGVTAMGGKHYENCWGFVRHEDSIWPLYTDFHYYIMTGNGQTFEHLKPH